jgi:hypothetical protein
MGRDALFVDLMLQPTAERNGEERVFRVCTTHLESFGAGISLRTKQLQLIAEKLMDDPQAGQIAAGLVGGDMNALDGSESGMHREMGLRDVWEETTSLGSGETETSRGGNCGHTWGYQSHNNQRAPKRLDKFFYVGGLQTLSVTESPEEIEMAVGLLGVGLKAMVPLSQFPDEPTLSTDAGES